MRCGMIDVYLELSCDCVGRWPVYKWRSLQELDNILWVQITLTFPNYQRRIEIIWNSCDIRHCSFRNFRSMSNKGTHRHSKLIRFLLPTGFACQRSHTHTHTHKRYASPLRRTNEKYSNRLLRSCCYEYSENSILILVCRVCECVRSVNVTFAVHYYMRSCPNRML